MADVYRMRQKNVIGSSSEVCFVSIKILFKYDISSWALNHFLALIIINIIQKTFNQKIEKHLVFCLFSSTFMVG